MIFFTFFDWFFKRYRMPIATSKQKPNEGKYKARSAKTKPTVTKVCEDGKNGMTKNAMALRTELEINVDMNGMRNFDEFKCIVT